MSRQRRFEGMIATRIELASSRAGALAAAAQEGNAEQRELLEECGEAIALATNILAGLKIASGAEWVVSERTMIDAWHRMEAAVRRASGEPPVTLVPALIVPSSAAPLPS